jgi:diguanylate cyclase (GGDEF)-like protein
MTESQVRGLIGFIGIAAQLGGAMLLVALFALLRRYARGRAFFVIWQNAWIAVSVAIGAVVIRYLILPRFEPQFIQGDPGPLRSLTAVYQLGKLAYIGLMVHGTASFARSDIVTTSRLRWSVVLGVVYGLFPVLTTTRSADLVVWQAPVMILGFTYCAYLLLTLPRERRSVGSRVAGVCFTLIASLWTVYVFAFNTASHLLPGIPRSGLEVVVVYNSYVDLLLQVLLGYAMVVMLMEDRKREVDDAHAALAEAHEQLQSASYHDTLTGALNRRAFVEGVGLSEAHASGGSVVALDLDNLKLVNDSFGHAAGDKLLRRLAEVVRSIVRPSDTLYRWGGDEFLLVLPGAHTADVQPRVEEVITQSNLLRVREAGPEDLRLLVSVGAADFTGAADLEAAIERADNAMYAQKAQRKLLPIRPTGLRAIPSA